jgi:hypothetical protein
LEGGCCDNKQRVLSMTQPLRFACVCWPARPLQVRLQDMRAKLPDLVDPRRDEDDDDAGAAGDQQQQQQGDQQQQQQAGGSSSGGQAQQQQHAPSPGQQQQQRQAAFDDIDDDELLELQNEAAMVRGERASVALRLWLAS